MEEPLLSSQLREQSTAGGGDNNVVSSIVAMIVEKGTSSLADTSIATATTTASSSSLSSSNHDNDRSDGSAFDDTRSESSTALNNGRCWSWSSICFLLGSVFYAVDSVWDLCSTTATPVDDEGVSDDYEYDYDYTYKYDASEICYWVFTFLGSLFYLLNGILETNYACQQYGCSTDNNDEYIIESGHHHHKRSSRRRNLKRYVPGVLFGIAATLDLIGALTGYENEVLSMVPSHLYFLQAVLAVTVFRDDDEDWALADQNNQDDASSSSSSSSTATFVGQVTQMGDMLFVLGSSIDVTICYLDLEGMEESHVFQMRIWGLISSLLWFLDAICYLYADAIEYYYYLDYQRVDVPSTSTYHFVISNNTVEGESLAINDDGCSQTEESSDSSNKDNRSNEQDVKEVEIIKTN